MLFLLRYQTNRTQCAQVERIVSTHKYPAENAWLSLTSYRVIPLGTTPNCLFLVRSKTKIVELLQLCAHSNLRNLGCNTLDQVQLQTQCIVEMPSSLFFILDHAHCHQPTLARLSNNHMQLPKTLNNANIRTVTMSLCGPFHPGACILVELHTF